MSRMFNRMQPVVFIGSAAVVVGFCVFGGGFTETASATFANLQSWISEFFGWYYVLAASFFLIFILWLVAGPFGSVRLGKEDDRPEYGRVPWFIMLFAAGMGTGLVFWGVAEPLSHYAEPPLAEPETAESARQAMRYAFFHWGLHPWAIYMIFAVSIAYFHFRVGLPLAPRSILYPLLRERIHGPIGHGVDILCTVGTLLGVATSLGLGAMQINVGLNTFAPVTVSTFAQVVIIAVITLVATISVVLGVKRGIRRLSMLNLMLAAVLLAFVLFAGPTVAILETFVTSIGLYLQTLVQTSFSINFARDTQWQATWTLFYWGWWISWSPFVGIFVARISKGRTVRELIAAGLVVPTLVTFFWMATFGGAALQFELEGASLAERVIGNVEISLHAMLSLMPWANVTMVLATAVVVIFFITSSDSGSLVDDIVTSGGHPHPPVSQRIFWAVSEGAVAATLLIVGGLNAIQQAAISLGLPMSLLLVAACFSLYAALAAEAGSTGIPSKRRLKTEAPGRSEK